MDFTFYLNVATVDAGTRSTSCLDRVPASDPAFYFRPKLNRICVPSFSETRAYPTGPILKIRLASPQSSCWRIRPRNLRCGLSEPGFEASLAEPCGIVRQECSEAHLRPGVKRLWISDDLASIFECGQSLPDQ